MLKMMAQLIAKNSLRSASATQWLIGAEAQVMRNASPKNIARSQSHSWAARTRRANDALHPQIVHADIGYQYSER